MSLSLPNQVPFVFCCSAIALCSNTAQSLLCTSISCCLHRIAARALVSALPTLWRVFRPCFERVVVGLLTLDGPLSRLRLPGFGWHCNMRGCGVTRRWWGEGRRRKSMFAYIREGSDPFLIFESAEEERSTDRTETRMLRRSRTTKYDPFLIRFFFVCF
jgi:hypothetical protein